MATDGAPSAMYEKLKEDEQAEVPELEEEENPDLETAKAASENDANEQLLKEEEEAEELPEKYGFEEEETGIEMPKSKLKLGRKAPELPLIERRNWLIHYHFVRKDFMACKALIKEQLDECEAQCEYALYVKGMVSRIEGRLQESLDMLQQCAMLDPSNYVYVKQIGRALFLLAKHKQAIEVFKEAVKLNQYDWEIYHWQALCHYHMNDSTKAKESLILALQLRRNEHSLQLLGKIATKEGDLMTAIEAYKKALDFCPENTDLLTTVGLMYLKTDSFTQAFESLGRALSHDPSHTGAILAAGSMMQQHGDFDVALTKYRVAARNSPDNAQLWSNIGMCFYGKGKLVAAISCLKRANYLAPLDWKIQYNLGLVHLAMQQDASAFHFVSAAINLQPKAAILYMTLAVILTHLEDTDNAKQAYERAASLDSLEPTIALNFAIFHYKQGNMSDSVMWLEQFDKRAVKMAQKPGVPKMERETIDGAEKLRTLLSQGSTGMKSGTEQKPSYLSKDELDREHVIVPPSSAGSGADKDRSQAAYEQTVQQDQAIAQQYRPKTDSNTTLSSRHPTVEDQSIV